MVNEMTRIGILTLPDPINYGACLQTFALQRYLNNIGVNAEVIDYLPDNSSNNQNIFRTIRSFVWRATLKRVLQDRLRLKKTEEFKRSFIRYSSSQYGSTNDLDSCSYNVGIVGSDQVWNPHFAANDSSWFLNHGSFGRRAAYAASFGVSAIEKETQSYYAEMISKMDYISVREETGCSIVDSLTGVEPKVVMDPVFLLSKEEWASIANPVDGEPYVLCYYMPGFSDAEEGIRRLSQKIAKEHNLRIINIGMRDFDRLRRDSSNRYGVGPLDFLGLVNGASYVVTNSFHGTAFSLIFERPFYSIVDSGLKHGNLSSRLTDLLFRVGFDRNLIDVSHVNYSTVGDPVFRSSSLVEKEIEKSKDYLAVVVSGK